MFGGDDGDSLSQIGMLPPPLLSPPLPAQHLLNQLQSLQQQWSQEETRELIRVRAELESDFTVAKRNKTLWETVSRRMREIGYGRTPDQCKCKWKNILNRYKGIETSDPENARLCPFFDELHAVFTARANNMQQQQQQLHLESERVSAQAKRKSKYQLSDELSEGDEEAEDYTDEEKPLKRKAKKAVLGRPSKTGNGDVYEVLKEFIEQQQRMDVQWREMMERRAKERLLFEQEWRKSMERLERERLVVEQAWREREEQRKVREESIAERRDALLTTLLNKLIHEHNL